MSSQGPPVWTIDPLRDPRWQDLVEQHPSASVFHSRSWLQALQATYGYEPIAVTTAQPLEPLNNAVVFCVVRSWVTGHRVVSLPFSDHCEPLVAQSSEFDVLMKFVESLRQRQRWKYVQIRSVNTPLMSGRHLAQTKAYCLHQLDLRPGLDDLYGRLHRDCIQRKIRRSEREGLVCDVGRSESLLREFYGLLCLTRARQGIPPQPLAWFQNLVAYMGSSLCIWVAYKSGRPVAGILTLRQGKQIVYKYGASDPTQTHHGGTVRLLWEAIQQAKREGAESLDFGRSDMDNAGLITFKTRWAAESSILRSWETPAPRVAVREDSPLRRWAKELFTHLPGCMQVLAGRTLYRHMG